MNRPILLLAKFVAVTVPLTVLWMNGGQETYHRFFNWAAHPIFRLAGAPNSELAAAPQRFISYVPFLGLMLVTPGLTGSRKLWGTLVGAAILFASHVMFVLASVAAYETHGETPAAIRAVFPVMLFLDSLPFILWVVIAWPVLRPWVERTTERIFKSAERGS